MAGVVDLLMNDPPSAHGAPVVAAEFRESLGVISPRTVDPKDKPRPTKKRIRRVAGSKVDMASLRGNLR